MKIWEDEKQVYIRASMERNTPEQNAALKERLERIDWSILEHIQRKETVNERGVFAPLEAVEVPEIEARRDEFKAAGQDAIRAGKVGAVLLAGGQGTRLGLDRPKLSIFSMMMDQERDFQSAMKNSRLQNRCIQGKVKRYLQKISIVVSEIKILQIMLKMKIH